MSLAGDVRAVEPKAQLRAELRALRAAIDPEARARASEAACDLLLEWLPTAAATVALYVAFGDELDPGNAVAALRQWGVGVLLPRVAGSEIELVQAEAGAPLVPGLAGVPEPAGAAIELGDVDVVVLPGLGFTTDGARLGRGGGHYDRLLAALPPSIARVGLCFDEQVVAALPTEPHDERVDAIVTDRRTLVVPGR